MNIKILIATHKKYNMPQDEIYIPIHVGKEISSELGYLGDNTGENISSKNKNYCELTALYWAWKNIDSDIVGLMHYRRYLKSPSSKSNNILGIMKENEIEEILSHNDIILPRKRKYYIETIKTHYKNAHYIKDVDLIEKIIKKDYPDYVNAFNKVFSGRELHLYNMFIMKKEIFDDYCQWLFDILLKLEKEIDISNYDPYQARVYGFLSERLFNVWIKKQQLTKFELDIIEIEKTNKFVKAKNLIKRKFFGH